MEKILDICFEKKKLIINDYSKKISFTREGQIDIIILKDRQGFNMFDCEHNKTTFFNVKTQVGTRKTL